MSRETQFTLPGRLSGASAWLPIARHATSAFEYSCQAIVLTRDFERLRFVWCACTHACIACEVRNAGLICRDHGCNWRRSKSSLNVESWSARQSHEVKKQHCALGRLGPPNSVGAPGRWSDLEKRAGETRSSVGLGLLGAAPRSRNSRHYRRLLRSAQSISHGRRDVRDGRGGAGSSPPRGPTPL